MVVPVQARCLVVLFALSWCVATALPAPAIPHEALANSFSDAHGVPPGGTFPMDVHQLGETVNDDLDEAADAGDEGAAPADGKEPTRQLSPTTQSFLSTLGTALGPIVGAIVGPLLTNIGQNLSAGSGAQAIAQLQQAAQAAVAAQQLQQLQGGIAASASVEAPTPITPAPFAPSSQSPSSSTRPPVSVTPPPPPSKPSRPSGRPTARPTRPVSRPNRPTVAPATTPAPPRQTFDAFVLDVPGRGPFLFLMTPNVTAEEQSAAIQQAQQQAAQLLAVNGESSPIGAVAALIGSSSTPRPLPHPMVTKPTSVGPLPVRPFGTTPTPLPSYHKLLDQEDLQQGEEEVAVAESVDDTVEDGNTSESSRRTVKDDDSVYSAQSFLERLFPEMV